MNQYAVDILAVLRVFFLDGRVRTILGLILADVILALAAAIKAGTFDWRRLGEFYRTMVIPYVLGYLAFYSPSVFLLEEAWLGEYAELAGEAVRWIAWIFLVGNLVADILKSAKALGYAFSNLPPEGPPTGGPTPLPS